MKKFLAVLALLGSAFGFLMVVAAIDDLISGTNRSGIVIGLGIVFALMSFFSARWGIRVFRGDRLEAPSEQDQEKEVLRLAAQNGGQLSVAQLCNLSSLSLDQSQATLDDMMRKQVADIVVDDEGAIYYRFQGLLGSGSK